MLGLIQIDIDGIPESCFLYLKNHLPDSLLSADNSEEKFLLSDVKFSASYKLGMGFLHPCQCRPIFVCLNDCHIFVLSLLKVS